MFSLLNKKEIIALFLLSLIALAAFGKTYQNDFLGMDDHVYVWDNPYIRDGLTLNGIKWAFQADLTNQTEFADYWQPITFISRMIDISLFKFNSGAHHLVNLFFHIANIWLLYLVLLRITDCFYKSLWITALFAIHPMHAEIIGWATARKDVLSIFFGLITMLVYFWRRSNPKIYASFLLAFCFSLSLMSKPMMITLPVLLMLIDILTILKSDNSFKFSDIYKSALNKWPLFLMIALYLPIPFLGQPQAFEYEINHPIVKAFNGYLFYIQKIFFPLKLSLYGPIPEPKIPFLVFILSVLAVGLISLGLYLLRKKSWLPLFGWCWFLITTLPIIGLTWTADRFVYFPMIGIWIIFVGILSQFIKEKDFISSIIVVYIIFFFFHSFNQIGIWRNDETIMLRALEYSQDNYSAHNVLGVYYAKEEKDHDKALYHLKEAIRIRPERDKPYNNIGLILEQKGNLTEAAEYYELSLKRNNNDFRSLNNLAIVYFRGGNFKRAIDLFKKALEINPKATATFTNLAIVYYKSGEIKKAEAMANNEKSAFLFNQFGLFCITDKNFAQAKTYLKKALELDPNFPNTTKYLEQVELMLNQ